jgi:hypothetical protein
VKRPLKFGDICECVYTGNLVIVVCDQIETLVKTIDITHARPFQEGDEVPVETERADELRLIVPEFVQDDALFDHNLIDACFEAATKKSYQPQPPPPGSITLPPGYQLNFDPAILDNHDSGWIGDYPQSPATSEAEQWKKEGRCPQCGELGHFSHFAYVCSKHGTYT